MSAERSDLIAEAAQALDHLGVSVEVGPTYYSLEDAVLVELGNHSQLEAYLPSLARGWTLARAWVDPDGTCTRRVAVHDVAGEDLEWTAYAFARAEDAE